MMKILNTQKLYLINLRVNILRYLFSIRLINLNIIKNYFDYFLLIIVIFTLLGDFISLFQSFYDYFNINQLDLFNHMVNNTSSSTSTTSTSINTTIIHDDGNWSNGIRSLFIYGAGGTRLYFIRHGSPFSRAFVIAGTILGEAASKVVNNAINDPEYIKNHYRTWTSSWENEKEGVAKVVVDKETSTLLSKSIENSSNNNISNNFINGVDSLGDFKQDLLNGLFNKLKFILEPVQVNYSNELLSNQIYELSIVLFILSLIILGLIVVLLLNILIYINMDKIIKYFNNKFIKWYLLINKKFLGIEIFLLGGSIIYFMYSLIIGIRFIATHHIII